MSNVLDVWISNLTFTRSFVDHGEYFALFRSFARSKLKQAFVAVSFPLGVTHRKKLPRAKGIAFFCGNDIKSFFFHFDFTSKFELDNFFRKNRVTSLF